MKRSYLKVCACVLILTMLTEILPADAYATVNAAVSSVNSELEETNTVINGVQNEQPEEVTPPQVLGEIESERTAYEKQFYMSDHSIKVVVYSEPVHYYEDGEWKDIDNTLTLEKPQNSDDITGYANKAGDFSVKLAADTDEENLAKLEKDKYTLEFNLIKEEEPARPLKGVIDSQGNDIDEVSAGEIFDKEILTPNVVSDSVVYSGIADKANTDLEYKVTGSGLKENIIINEKQDTYEYSFQIKADNLQLTLKDNEITAADNKTGKFVYSIPAPFMYDASNRLSDAVAYELIKTADGYQLTIKADNSWINRKETKFPVIIDPVISTNEKGVIDSTFVASKTPNVNYSTYGSALVGVDTSVYNKCRTLLKVQMPELNQGDIIQGAYLNLLQYKVSSYTSSNPDMPVSAYRITRDWNVGNVTWNNMPDFGSGIDSNEIDYNYISVKDNGKTPTKTFNITKAAKLWYDGDDSEDDNFGIMLAAEKEDGNNSEVAINASYYMEDNQDSSAYPMLVLYYRNSKGIEDYYSYTSLSAGSAGNAYVNNYTGNLVFTQQGVTTSGLKMPVSIYPVYNVNNSLNPRFNTQQVSGFGWKLNIQQYIEDSSHYGLKDKAQDTYPYVYVDEDGTEHYLKKIVKDGMTTYVDEDGLGITATIKNNVFTMEDSKNTVMTFGSDNNLRSVKDANGNIMNIVYTDGIITSVQDGAGKVITVTSSADLKITGITDPSGRMTKYKTNEGRLTQVTRPDGTIETYSYDGKTLISITDSNGYGMEFTYLPSTKATRISTVREFGTNKGTDAKTYGQQMGFSYTDYNNTEVITSGADSKYGNEDDVITTYRFDSYGRLIATQARTKDGQIGASTAKYEDTSSENANLKKANRIKESISLESNVNNLLLNHNGESLTNWETIKTGDSTETIANSTFYHYTGSKSLKIGVASATAGSNVRLRQMLTSQTVVPGETYTLSGYVRTVGQTPLVSGTYGAGLLVYCYMADGSTTSYYSDYISSDTDSSINNGWRKLSVTFTVPVDAIKTSVNLLQRGTNGNAYFDALQLEKGKVANKYNFLENGSFENSNALYGYGNYNLTLSDSMDKPITNDSRFAIDGKVGFKVVGEKSKSKYLSQEVAVSGTEEDIYAISGWAKAYSISELIQNSDNSIDRKFKISIKVTYTDGTFVWKDPVEYTPDSILWQYGVSVINLSDGTSTVKTPSTITIYPRYDYQANAAYFDNLSIIKDSSVSYTYDDNGNLNSVAASAEQKANIEYDSRTNDLTKVKDAKGFDYQYTYDNKHNLTQAKSQKGVNYQYTYGSSSPGNPDSLTIQGGSLKILSNFIYNSGGNFLSSVADQDGYSTSYSYNEDKGTLQSVTDTQGNMISYTYDDKNDNLLSVKAINGDKTISNGYSYENGMLNSITHNDFQYLFRYDDFGNKASVMVGNNLLREYGYQAENGALASIKYGNNDTNTFSYDTYGNIVKESINGSERYQWYADNSGEIIKHVDLLNQLQYNYEYDTTDRLIRQEVIDTSKPASSQRNAYLTEYGYDVNNNITKLVNKAGSQTLVNLYGYIEDNLPSLYTLPSGKTVTYSYDSLNRLNSYEINTTTPIHADYMYSSSKRNAEGESTYRTLKIYQETVGNTGYRYSYDKLGNITNIKEKQSNGTYTDINFYKYDSLNQLIREDDAKQNLTKVYAYDQGGNIISIKEYAYIPLTEDLSNTEPNNTIDYEYGDTSWKDKLTAYNGQPITYDEIGNPLTYVGYNLTWNNGGELTTLAGNGVSASYTYDADGLRATKTVNGVKTTYQYLDGQLQYEKKGNTEVYYLYDADGKLKGLRTVNSGGTVKDYYVVTNTRGDVTQIYDEAGTLQAVYTYDAWGKILSIKDGSGNEVTSDAHIGKLNSLRYRGYYYDDEIRLYYVGSRYYDCNIGRYLNADDSDVLDNTQGGLINTNLFAYCLNNPVNHSDPSGYWVVDAIFLAADIAEMAMHPSAAGAAMILIDIVCFADASGAASAGVHAIEAGSKILKVAKVVDETKDVIRITDETHKFYETERAARRAAFRDAGIGKNGARIASEEEFKVGSRNSRGKTEPRKVWKSPDTKKTVAHDKYGHKNPLQSPHYNVYDTTGRSTHYYYPSKYLPY